MRRQIEGFHNTAKSPGLLDKRAAFDALLQTHFPKLLLCLGEDSAGEVLSKLDYNLSDMVGNLCALYRAQHAVERSKSLAPPLQVHKAAGILEKDLIDMNWEAGTGSRKALSTFKFAYVNAGSVVAGSPCASVPLLTSAAMGLAAILQVTERSLNLNYDCRREYYRRPHQDLREGACGEPAPLQGQHCIQRVRRVPRGARLQRRCRH